MESVGGSVDCAENVTRCDRWMRTRNRRPPMTTPGETDSHRVFDAHARQTHVCQSGDYSPFLMISFSRSQTRLL